MRKIAIIADFSSFFLAVVAQAEIIQGTPVASEPKPVMESTKPADEKARPHLRKVEVADATDSVTKLKNDIARQEADIKSLRQEVANLSSQLAAEKQEKEKASAELATLRESLAIGGNGKLLALADSAGERVFLKGVGEVTMATDSGKTVMKVPGNSESKADRVFASVRAEKVARNGYLYYIAPSAGLSW